MDSGILVVAALVAGAAIFLCDWVRRRRLKSRARSSEFESTQRRTTEEALAAQILFESIAKCFNVSPHQVRLNDDINRDFRAPSPLDLLTLDGPGEEIIETIKDRVAKAYPPWEPTTKSPRVADIIADLSRHLASAASERCSERVTDSSNK